MLSNTCHMLSGNFHMLSKECNTMIMIMIAFITFNSSLVPLFEGLWSSNPWEFELSGFRRNWIDDLGIDSPSLWPTEPRLHVRSCCVRNLMCCAKLDNIWIEMYFSDVSCSISAKIRAWPSLGVTNPLLFSLSLWHRWMTLLLRRCADMELDDDDCFYYHSWRNNVVIAFGTLSSFLT